MNKIKLLYISLLLVLNSSFGFASNIINIDTIVKSILNGGFATSEVIVVFKDGADLDNAISEINKLFSQNGVNFEKYNLINAIHFKVPTVAFETIKSELEESSLKDIIDIVEKNYKTTIASQSNDSHYGKLWAIENDGQSINGTSGTNDADMDIKEAWDKSSGSGEIVVAVLDTGVDYTHEDLADNMWSGNAKHGYDFAGNNNGDNDDDPMPDKPYDDNGHYHGTHVAGIIGAVGNNNKGVSGINQHVQIMALKVFRPNGDGYSSDILEALDYVAKRKDEGVKIVAVNASYAGGSGSQGDSVDKAIAKLGDKGIVFCAAAGNDGKDNDANPVYPASYSASNIIAVAATDQDDKLADFSNYGKDTVDVAAPGTNILSTYPDNQYAYLQGTSMATPYVTGLVALIASYAPDSSISDRIDAIKNSVDDKSDLHNKVATNGRVNAYKALTKFDDDSNNTAPVAENSSATTNEDTKVSITLKATDEDNDTLSYQITVNPQHGKLTGDAPNVTYTPDKDYNGNDSFKFKAYDGKKNSNEATVSIKIDAVNDAPKANDDRVKTDENSSVTIDVLSNDNDVDGDALSIKSYTNPSHGSTEITDNKIKYTPDNGYIGSDSFEYTIKDNSGENSTATVNIEVQDPNNRGDKEEYPTSGDGAKSVIEVYVDYDKDSGFFSNLDKYTISDIKFNANKDNGEIEITQAPMPMPNGKLGRGTYVDVTDSSLVVEFDLDSEVEF